MSELSHRAHRERLRSLLYLAECGLEGADEVVRSAVVVVETVNLRNTDIQEKTISPLSLTLNE